MYDIMIVLVYLFDNKHALCNNAGGCNENINSWRVHVCVFSGATKNRNVTQIKTTIMMFCVSIFSVLTMCTY